MELWYFEIQMLLGRMSLNAAIRHYLCFKMNDMKGDFNGHKVDIGGEMAIWEGMDWDVRILETKDTLLYSFV